MSQSEMTTVSGDVTDVFAHRFVVRTATGTVLADLGPRGTERIKLNKGDHVELLGEKNPSELKVVRVAKSGAEPVVIEHGKPAGHLQDADPAAAIRTVEANGFVVVGHPRRKPKHFEILGRDKGDGFVELHVGIDGTLRKSKPVSANDAKWGEDLGQDG